MHKWLKVLTGLKSDADAPISFDNGFTFRGKTFVHHSALPFDETAFFRLTPIQIAIGIWTIIFILIWLIINPRITVIGLLGLITTIYFLDLAFTFLMIFRSFAKKPEIKIKPEEVDPNREWPFYTIFCPLYQEWQVLPQFVTAMSRLDYPADKLQVMLLLEEDDQESVEHAKNFNLPSNFEIVVVPNSMPKTKPKACNYGLVKARGEYCVIFDAEDVPEADQLKKAVVAFEKMPDNVACIQAKLNFYNPHQNLLTRIFTAEYSLWFDLVLTGLQSVNAPIPLGGTSNHFKTDKLRELKGWDAFNVTEDCDLGIRLFKKGLKTAIIDSTTHEEANSEYKNWFGQRTRWIKGYIQTYFVHMRRPRQLAKDWKDPHIVSFQLIVGTRILAMLINPFMWMLTFTYFVLRPWVGPTIESFFPAPVLYMGVFCAVVGNFMYFYYYMIGCAKRGYFDLIKYGFLVPLYWLMMSAAAWVASYKLIVAPHYWYKTKHGLHLKSQENVDKVMAKVGGDLVDRRIAGVSQ